MKYCPALWTIFLTFEPITINNKNILSLSVTETKRKISLIRGIGQTVFSLYYVWLKKKALKTSSESLHLVDINVERHDNALTYSISDWSKGHAYNILYIYNIIRHYYFFFIYYYFLVCHENFETTSSYKNYFFGFIVPILFVQIFNRNVFHPLIMLWYVNSILS